MLFRIIDVRTYRSTVISSQEHTKYGVWLPEKKSRSNIFLNGWFGSFVGLCDAHVPNIEVDIIIIISFWMVFIIYYIRCCENGRT